LSAPEQFQEWYEKRHKYAQEWKKRTGGKILGYLCTYIPEEILYAANILPVRVLGSHQPQSVTEPHIFAMYCPFCRDCLAQGLQHRYDYLDGLMIAKSCLHIRQTYHSWKKHVPLEFNYFLPMPSALQSRGAVPFLREEIDQFKKAVEKWVGREIGEADLKRGIEVMNENRSLMKDVYELRKQNTPPISGVESMYMVISSQLVDKEEHSKVVGQWLSKDLATRLQHRDPGLRLMIIGSENDDIEFLKMVEQEGPTIVCDDHCTGSRYFWDEVQPNSDHILAIAKRYVERTPCPSKDWPNHKRFNRILEFARSFRVNGVIVARQKFCDPHEADEPFLRQMLESHGIKTLVLELDVTLPRGPFRTRFDAFVEMLSQDGLV